VSGLQPKPFIYYKEKLTAQCKVLYLAIRNSKDIQPGNKIQLNQNKTNLATVSTSQLVLQLQCAVPKPANHIAGGIKILPGKYSVFAF
jgi:hypothetical protein